MNKLKIFFAEDNEYSEVNSIDGGSRHDVIVQIGEVLYHPAFYHIITLTQEFNDSVKLDKVYEIDNSVILIEEVSKKEIIRAILSLYKAKYFDKVKPIDLNEEYKDSFELFPKLQTLSGWVQVY